MLLYIGLILTILGSVYCSDVIELEDSSFAAEVKRHDIILVEFFAPWCGHCKRLAPEYESAATALKRSDPPVPLAKVDCTEKGKDSCGKYGVSGYPTLKIFRNGEFFKEYDGPRESDGIIGYMKKQAGPSSKELIEVKDVMEIVDNSEEAFTIGFFAGGDDDLRKAFMTTADEMRDKYRFAHTTSAEVMEYFQHKDEIVIFRPSRLRTKLESPKEVYSGSADDFYIKKFLKSKLHGLVGHMTQENEDQFNMPLCTVFYKVDYKRNTKGTNYWRNRVMKVAQSFKDKVMNYAIANGEDFGRVLDGFGLTPSDKPVATIKNEVGDKFLMTADKFSVETFKQFLQDYFNGKLQPYIKSEKVPESNDGPVKVVVGKTFKEIANDPTKDVLIEFYAPWCGHCKSLEPKYNELGEKFKNVKDIVIAKMDATANDVPSPFKVEGFPTIYWAPMNNKVNPEKYSGGREVSDFIDFIKSKSTNPFSLDEKKKSKKSKKIEKEEL